MGKNTTYCCCWVKIGEAFRKGNVKVQLAVWLFFVLKFVEDIKSDLLKERAHVTCHL